MLVALYVQAVAVALQSPPHAVSAEKGWNYSSPLVYNAFKDKVSGESHIIRSASVGEDTSTGRPPQGRLCPTQ